MTEVNAAKAFTVIADEATDSATIEQLSISVRYVDAKVVHDSVQHPPRFVNTAHSRTLFVNVFWASCH